MSVVSYKEYIQGRYCIADIPGDKSLSHRAIIIGALADNVSVFTHFLFSDDCLCTLDIFRQLGVIIHVDRVNKRVEIEGCGLYGLTAPDTVLDVGNSGTAIRLISGVLVGQAFSSTIVGDASICKRPMKRVTQPLREMGADVIGCSSPQHASEEYPPLKINPVQALTGLTYAMPHASAQVKSALLLAGLYASGPTQIKEPGCCRDHTERLLSAYGASVTRAGSTVTLTPGAPLRNPYGSRAIRIPGDISSAAFFIVLALICPGMHLTLAHVGLNPTRSALLDVLKKMGGNLEIDYHSDAVEPTATVTVLSSQLHNIKVDEALVPNLIDEIPILAVAALFATGTLILSGARELRVKESDRIAQIVALVRAFEGTITEHDDGFELQGGCTPVKPVIQTAFDHRIAMSAIIAGVAASVPVELDTTDCIATSFPEFFDLLARVSRDRLLN